MNALIFHKAGCLTGIDTHISALTKIFEDQRAELCQDVEDILQDAISKEWPELKEHLLAKVRMKGAGNTKVPIIELFSEAIMGVLYKGENITAFPPTLDRVLPDFFSYFLLKEFNIAHRVLLTENEKQKELKRLSLCKDEDNQETNPFFSGFTKPNWTWYTLSFSGVNGASSSGY